MCFGRPKPPPLPEQEPVDSAIEQTATKVVVGDKRKSLPTRRRRDRMTPVIGRKRFGTKSLQIPLLANSTNAGNLNYS